MGGSDSFSHVGNISHFNKTVSFGERPLVVGSNVNVLPPRPELGVHGTIHVERQEDEGVVFSAGVMEPVKRSIGKWKKEARLKGGHGLASSFSMKLKIAKRKMEVELLVGDAAKVRRTEGLLSEVTELAEAVVQPRQGQ